MGNSQLKNDLPTIFQLVTQKNTLRMFVLLYAFASSDRMFRRSVGRQRSDQESGCVMPC